MNLEADFCVTFLLSGEERLKEVFSYLSSKNKKINPRKYDLV